VATCTQATCVCTPCAYYDWRTVGKQKLPTLFRPASGLFGFAGLWETWHGGHDGEPLDTFTILTTDATATVAPTHDRMPVIVEPTNYAPGWMPRGARTVACCGRTRPRR
jgi:putative SOS response-associated peptidase YedK